MQHTPLLKPTSILPLLALALSHPAGAAYVWLGGSNGLNLSPVGPLGGDGASLYAENNWDDDSLGGVQAPAADSVNTSTQSPAGINAPLIVNNGFVAGGANGAGSNTAHLRANGNAITVTGAGAGIKLAVMTSGAAAWIENDATIGGARSTLTVTGGGFVTTGQLRDMEATLSGSGSSIWFVQTQNNGLGGNNSLIDLVGAAAGSPALYFADITAANLFTAAVLGSITVNGAPAVWGADPLVYEPGDNLLATAEVFNRANTAQLPQNNWYGVNRNGFALTIIPEPSVAGLLTLVAGLGLVRRRR